MNGRYWVSSDRSENSNPDSQGRFIDAASPATFNFARSPWYCEFRYFDFLRSQSPRRAML
jgi:hypothetical protein